MATGLQQQLAAIAANSTHQLDLKAQKSRHSKSLLFEPRDAATQDFETIYQICIEGFEELCVLDVRFNSFGRNLFSEQSKTEDRLQMTSKENEELDKTIESFLSLICGRLLLKPAMKAVEWLVRRFRIQDHNMECVLLTFLPYHTSHIFPTMLSILPEQLPANFKFLQPYMASVQCPPRHAILSAAISAPAFFSAFNQYAIQAARAGHGSTVLLGFWASLTAQAVNGMIDATRSGRQSVRKQREEDAILKILPIFQDVLSMKGNSELYLGTCTIVAVFVTKTSLEDQVLDAIMEGVAGAWTNETMQEGVQCLAILAEEKHQISQPRSVTKRLVRTANALSSALALASSHRASKLLASTAISIISRAVKADESTYLAFVKALLDTQELSDRYALLVYEAILAGATQFQANGTHGDNVFRTISSLLSSLVEKDDNRQLLRRAMENTKFDHKLVDLPIEFSNVGAAIDQNLVALERGAMEQDTYTHVGHARFESLLEDLPGLPIGKASFLDSITMDAIFKSYVSLFEQALNSQSDMDRLLAVRHLHQSELFTRPAFFSFLARTWTGDVSTAAKTRALVIAQERLETFKDDGGTDMQAIFPYAIAALVDHSRKVRSAAAELCRSIYEVSDKTNGKNIRSGFSAMYGTIFPEEKWLSPESASKFLNLAIVPVLEDSVLDGEYLLRALPEVLTHGVLGSAEPAANKPHTDQLKKAIRGDVCEYLASVVVWTPVLSVQLCMLRILNKTGKYSTHAKSAILAPFVRYWASRNDEDAASACLMSGLELKDMDSAVIGCLQESDLIRELEARTFERHARLLPVAFERLRHVFKVSKSGQLDIARNLLEWALQEADVEDETSQERPTLSLDVLRSLSLSTDVLAQSLEDLPNVKELQDRPSPAKKQRTNRSEALSRSGDGPQIRQAIRRITVILELIESSKPKGHAHLLKGLFHLLGELHHYKNLTGSDLVYVQGLLLGCLLSVVEGLKLGAATADIDRSVIRTDLVVECMRTTASTQIHNTALLLISALADWAPELVLHSVMPLFTFMSSTLLRQNDDFSAHVADQTVTRIVPALSASLKKKGRNLISGVAELLLSFVAAFEHIPLHRRFDLLKKLIESLGPEDSLFAVLAMLVERYPTDSTVAGFIVELSNSFSPPTALGAAKQYLDLVFDALKPKRNLSETLFSMSEKDGDAIEDSVCRLLFGLSQVLANSKLRKRLAANLTRDSQIADRIHNSYVSLLEHVMKFGSEAATQQSISSAAQSVLQSVLSLLPTKDFIESSAQLMQVGSDQTRQQVFQSLENRVSQAKRADSASQEVFVGVLQNCAAFIRQDQPVATRHAAISCIDQISEKYGKTNPAAVLSAAEKIAGEAALQHSDQSLQLISVLCLASMIEVLGEESVPILPNILAQTASYLKVCLTSEVSGSALSNAGFGLLCAMLDHVPWILSANMLDQSLELAALATLSEAGDPAQDFRSLVAKKLGVQELFIGIDRTWNTVFDKGAGPLSSHLSILHQAVQHHTKATITKNAQILFTIMLKAFDVRRQLQQSEEGKDHDELYALIDRIALEMTLKLNDATFKPFFLRLVEWATTGLPKKDAEGPILRLTSVYSFSLVFFEQLRSLVTSYAGLLLENASSVLTASAADNGSQHQEQLLDLLLRTLSSSFRHDQDDFWQAPSHFDVLAGPLISQLAAKHSNSLSDLVVSTITDLAFAAASPEHHKSMNTKIMALMRHETSAVRLAAVKCERSITERVNLDWLALLPEMLPFISELQEDDDENVERENLRWINQIEEVTGESLEGMLA